MYLGHAAPDWTVVGRHDLIIVNMEWAHRAPHQLRRIRRANPEATILAYVTVQEIVRPQTVAGLSDRYRYRRQLARNLRAEWWLRNSSGAHISLYHDTWMLNPASGWGQHLARFMARTVMGTGLFDGVYYDNAWSSPDWLGREQRIDMDGDGRADIDQYGPSGVASRWDAAMVGVFAETRRLSPGIVLMGNGSAGYYEAYGRPFQPPHHRWLNGALDEHWPRYNQSWERARMRSDGWMSRARQRPLFVVQAEPAGWKNDPVSDLAGMRFAFASAQLFGAHFAYSRGDHQQSSWWYDEFFGAGLGRHYLGVARGPVRRVGGVFLRRFAHGLVAVNPGTSPLTVTLPRGVWRHLSGRQDAGVNNGRRVTRLTVPPRDGRVVVAPRAARVR